MTLEKYWMKKYFKYLWNHYVNSSSVNDEIWPSITHWEFNTRSYCIFTVQIVSNSENSQGQKGRKQIPLDLITAIYSPVWYNLSYPRYLIFSQIIKTVCLRDFQWNEIQSYCRTYKFTKWNMMIWTLLVYIYWSWSHISLQLVIVGDRYAYVSVW